jgi:hypothetical protein
MEEPDLPVGKIKARQMESIQKVKIQISPKKFFV